MKAAREDVAFVALGRSKNKLWSIGTLQNRARLGFLRIDMILIFLEFEFLGV